MITSDYSKSREESLQKIPFSDRVVRLQRFFSGEGGVYKNGAEYFEDYFVIVGDPVRGVSFSDLEKMTFA